MTVPGIGCALEDGVSAGVCILIRLLTLFDTGELMRERYLHRPSNVLTSSHRFDSKGPSRIGVVLDTVMSSSMTWEVWGYLRIPKVGVTSIMHIIGSA